MISGISNDVSGRFQVAERSDDSECGFPSNMTSNILRNKDVDKDPLTPRKILFYIM